MATEFIHVKGKASYVRNITPDTDFQKDDGTGAAWTMILHPDNESLEIIRDLQAQGMKNTLKKDDDGYYIRWKRPTALKVKGRLKSMEPPVCTHKDGSPLGHDQLVGNGSDVVVRLEVYSHKTPTGGTAKAARWLALRVDNFIPYEGKPVNEGNSVARAIKGIEDQPGTWE